MKTLRLNKCINKTIGMIVLFSFYIVFAWCYISREGTILNLNSDTAAEVMYYLASKEQGTIAPEEWMGGSMLHVNALLLFPATWFMGENYVLCWNVMSFAITVILFGSIVVFTRNVFRNNSWILIIPILFSTIFPQMTRLYIIYAEYSVGLSLMLLFVAFYVGAVDSRGKVINKRAFVLSIILLFFACVIGTQGIQMITLPIIGALILKTISEGMMRTDSLSGKLLWRQYKSIILIGTLVGGGESSWVVIV